MEILDTRKPLCACGDGEAEGGRADFWGSADGTSPSPEGNSLNDQAQPQEAWALGCHGEGAQWSHVPPGTR